MDRDVEVQCDLGESNADIALSAEPQAPPILQPGSHGLRDEQARVSVVRSDNRGIVKQGPKVEDLQDIRIRLAQHISIGNGQLGEDLGKLALAGCVQSLQ